MKFFGITLIVFVLALTLVHGVLMLFSPRLWFRIPKWIRGGGYFSDELHSRGWQTLPLRLTGLCMVSMVLYVLYSRPWQW